MPGQIWATNSLGNYMYSDELSKELRMAVQPLVKFRQFADAKDATNKGLHKGQLFQWNVFSDLVTAGTTLVETSTMPETNFTVQQGTLTLVEHGNSVPFTQLLDNFSEQPVREVIQQVLKNDTVKAMDVAAHAQFKATPLRWVTTTQTSSGTLYTDGTATGTNSIAMNKDHVKAIVDTMKERNIPPYLMDDYFALAHPTTFRQLKNDMETLHQYVDRGLGLIMNGEIGRYEGVRFIEQTNITKANIGGTFTGNAKSNGAYFFGADTVAEAIAVPEEIRGKLPTDFGRSRGVAWYYLGGFGLVHSQQLQGRIVMWSSAA